jgi:protein gp37
MAAASKIEWTEHTWNPRFPLDASCKIRPHTNTIVWEDRMVVPKLRSMFSAFAGSKANPDLA